MDVWRMWSECLKSFSIPAKQFQAPHTHQTLLSKTIPPHPSSSCPSLFPPWIWDKRKGETNPKPTEIKPSNSRISQERIGWASPSTWRQSPGEESPRVDLAREDPFPAGVVEKRFSILCCSGWNSQIQQQKKIISRSRICGIFVEFSFFFFVFWSLQFCVQNHFLIFCYFFFPSILHQQGKKKKLWKCNTRRAPGQFSVHVDNWFCLQNAPKHPAFPLWWPAGPCPAVLQCKVSPEEAHGQMLISHGSGTRRCSRWSHTGTCNTKPEINNKKIKIKWVVGSVLWWYIEI